VPECWLEQRDGSGYFNVLPLTVEADVQVHYLILEYLHIEHGRARRELDSVGPWRDAQTIGISTHEDCD
jgi:hypothetical protein